MSWASPDDYGRVEDAGCCFCGARPPTDAAAMRSQGWQLRHGYPLRYRCPACRERQHRVLARWKA